MIVANQLTRRFGRIVAVDGIDFEIPRGRVVGFLGHNGAGKTTTIRMITGSLPPTAGRVTVDELDVVRHPLEARRRIGYLPESTPLYPEMRVSEYLMFRARLFGVERRRRKPAMEQVIERCWLEDVRRRPIAHLSKGYRQRVGLAGAMLHDPPVLVLDEPTSGLDPSQIRAMRRLVRELAGAHTVLLSTHILSEAELVCDDIIMIARGRIQAHGSVRDLQSDAAQGCRYVVETDATNADKPVGRIKGVDRVESVPLPDGWRRLFITPHGGTDDLREAIGACLRQENAAVRELSREAATLEQMFVRLIEEPKPIVTPRVEVSA